MAKQSRTSLSVPIDSVAPDQKLDEIRTHSTVRYPSSICSLERHEIYPYDRFAYHTLRTGIEALCFANLPTSLIVDFDPEHLRLNPHLLYAGITVNSDADGSASAFTVGTTPITPAALLGICHSVAPHLYATEDSSEPKDVTEVVKEFGACLAEALAQTRSENPRKIVREFLANAGITCFNIHKSQNDYELATSFIANHEIAHAYSGQLTHNERLLKNVDSRAFEIIVDLIAVNWLYNKIVQNTPDTEEYRKFRELDDHSEAIRTNAQMVVQGQTLVFIFLCFASAVTNEGKISLGRSDTHPHALLRYLLQQCHFMTLVVSRQKEHFEEKHISQLRQAWSAGLHFLCSSGLVDIKSVKALGYESTYSDAAHAARLINEFEVSELTPVIPFLTDSLKKAGQQLADRLQNL